MNLQFIYFYYVDETITNLLLLVSTCTGDWKKGPEFCYLAVEETKTWQEASSFCSSKGGHLLSIQNQEENDYIYGMFPLNFVL